MNAPISRRRLLIGGLAASVTAFVAACTRRADRAAKPAATNALPPTPACTDGHDEPTVEQTEGPYFTPNSPEKSNLAADVDSGTKLALTGTVLTTSCQPVAHALLDFWQADAAGNYDNQGFRLRGHQFTDADGRYALTTVIPGLYPGRTRHIHVKVQAPNGPALTTQLYFPGELQNASDGIFRPECLIDMADAAQEKTGTFVFVVET